MTMQQVRVVASETPSATIGWGSALPQVAAERPRVLVAEDDEDLRVLLCSELRREGFLVVACASAREAVRQREWIHAMAGNPWSLDVVVADLRLGAIDGLALLQRVAEAGVDVPVVLISAFGDAPARVRAGDLGAAAFLDKPVAMERLRGLVHQLAWERQRRVRGKAQRAYPPRWRRFEG